jgi:predicted ribosome quality control (RQC) complex YloA/Tae2 family protein
MKESLSFLEVTALVRELESLSGAKVNKIFNPSKKEIILDLHHPELRKASLRIVAPRYITVSEYKQENPIKPSHFAMFLRKYLTNARLVAVRQQPYERIVEFHFEKEGYYILVCELFSKGNVIICDKEHKILVPLESQSWRDRNIRPGETYVLPPKDTDFDDLDIERFMHILVSSGKNQIVKAIAIVLGIGGTYAEELCLNSGIEKTKKPAELSEEDYRLLFKNFLSMVEMSKEAKIEPHIVLENNIAVDVLPFKLNIYSDKEKKDYPSFMKALDDYFMKYYKEERVTAKETDIDKDIAKQELILKQHTEYFEEIKNKSANYKKYGDLVYQHLGELQSIMHQINSAREKNISWRDITKKIEEGKSKGNKEALLIKEIFPERAIVVVNIGDGVELDFRVSVTDIANDYYTRAKKLESKISGVEAAVLETQQKIAQLRQSREQITGTVEAEAPQKVEKTPEEWYERFHWFFTADGKLAIGGRDATQNEVLMKKYVEPNDLIFHTDAPGSPFVILKNGSSASASEKKEAAIFVLCNSKAWQEKRVSDVYAVNPEQVSKKAPAGEYIAKGGFMIYGKKEYIKEAELRYAVGIQIEPLKVVSGPVENVRLKARYYAILIPGELDKDEI